MNVRRSNAESQQSGVWSVFLYKWCGIRSGRLGRAADDGLGFDYVLMVAVLRPGTKPDIRILVGCAVQSVGVGWARIWQGPVVAAV